MSAATATSFTRSACGDQLVYITVKITVWTFLPPESRVNIKVRKIEKFCRYKNIL